MNPDIWGGDCRVAAYGGRLCGVASERATPLVRLPCFDEWSIDSTGKTAKGQAGWGGRNLALPHGEVHIASDGAGRQFHLWNQSAGVRGGSGHQGGDTRYAPAMVKEIPGGGMRVSTH